MTAHIPVPDAPPATNPVQRWYVDRQADWYASLPPDRRSIAIERDRFLLSAHALGIWIGMLCGIAGTTVGLTFASPSVPPWFGFLLAAGTFAGLFMAGRSAWLNPERFNATRLRRIAAFGLLATYAGAIASFRGELGKLVDAGLPWYEAVLRVMWRATPLQLMLFIAALLLLAAVSTARREYLQRALDQARAEHERDAAAAQLTQARLNLLQAQIQPHFLFNTLAALQHWVDVGDARAAPLLRALTGFLRNSTELMLQPDASLAQEADTARHYLAIMQARLGDRLRFAIDIAPDCLDQALPPGLLITLVENALEHGIEPQLGGGTVDVVARRQAGVFELRVLDDGAGLAAGAVDGLGLANCRERLRHRFGARAALHLQPRRDAPGTEVLLRLKPVSS